MMKRLTFSVTLEFEGSVTSDEEIKEVAWNVHNALLLADSEQGLAPKLSDSYVSLIVIEEPLSQIKLFQLKS